MLHKEIEVALNTISSSKNIDGEIEKLHQGVGIGELVAYAITIIEKKSITIEK